MPRLKGRRRHTTGSTPAIRAYNAMVDQWHRDNAASPLVLRREIERTRAKLKDLEIAYLNRLFCVVDTRPRRFPVP